MNKHVVDKEVLQGLMDEFYECGSEFINTGYTIADKFAHNNIELVEWEKEFKDKINEYAKLLKVDNPRDKSK